MKLDNRILALIAVGASVPANCQPCLEHQVGTALDSGADVLEIADALEVGKLIRRAAGAEMDLFAASLNDGSFTTASIDIGCGCCSPVKATGGRYEQA
jgi:hypothetical protein